MGTPNIQGTFTTIVWGTSNILQGTLATNAIVLRGRYTPLGGEPIKIEGNAGFTAIVVTINDGDRVEVDVIDDSSKTWPVKGDVIIVRPPGNAANKNMLVVDTPISRERKAAGERTIVVEAYTDIALSAS